MLKKISKTAAMLVVVVMLASSFTGCLSYVGRTDPTLNRVLFAVVDIVFLPISLIALVVYLIINEAADAEGFQMLLASSDGAIPSELSDLVLRIFSLPDGEYAALMQLLDSLPQAQRASSMERMAALSEEDRASLIAAYNALPPAEISASLERITALTESGIADLLQTFISKTQEELNSLTEELRGMSGVAPAVALSN